MPEDQQAKKTKKRTAIPFQKRKQLERDLAHITEEMYRRNKELAETNKTLTLLRTIDAMVLESHASLKTVCAHIAKAITQATDYPFVGLFTRLHANDEHMRLMGWSGRDYLGVDKQLNLKEPLHLRMDDPWLAQVESTRLATLENVSIDEIMQFLDCRPADLRRLLKQIPLKSVYEVKLTVRRRVVGVLFIGFYQSVESVTEADTLTIDRLSESIGVALDNKLLFEENQRVVRQLRDSNAKLRELDEAKDDFVSMASHQLRTPLTSAKGYVSMVLEGDAGKINEQQRKLLTQAYYSSQRMVYLIADLLNVSRLRTGKFIIENSPVNLAEVVEQEMDQLEKEAATRSVVIHYAKPKQFPTLLLDETKLRQIIMNFADNAIYYTPAGGEVAVSLVETEKTVEFRIKDNGIGVPKKEQPHLFTKFYRANNARKARPDGTGLGLFMAKKVIIAQGGSLIFESKEGKGSTFGFVFSKAKHALPEAKKQQ